MLKPHNNKAILLLWLSKAYPAWHNMQCVHIVWSDEVKPTSRFIETFVTIPDKQLKKHFLFLKARGFTLY